MTQPTLTFRTNRSARIADSCMGVLLGGGIALAIPMLSLPPAWRAIHRGTPPVLVAAVVLAVVLFAWRLAWRRATCLLRFRLVFHLDHLEVGGGWLRKRFAYDDIDEVRLPGPKARGGSWVEIWSGATYVRVILSHADAMACWGLLARLCPNTVFADAEGREHIRLNDANPIRSLLSLERQQRRSGVKTIWGGAICLFVSGMLVVFVTRWWLGRAVARPTLVVRLAFVSVLLLTVGVLAIRRAFQSLRLSRRARRERRALIRNSLPTDSPSPADRESLLFAKMPRSD